VSVVASPMANGTLSVRAGPGRADQQDVGFIDLDRRFFFAGGEPLVMVVDRDAERALGDALADDVLVQELLELPRCRDRPDAGPA